MIWSFENLSNHGAGGSVTLDKACRMWAEDAAHDHLRGWYSTVKFWNGRKYYSLEEACCFNSSNMELLETHYFNSREVVVGKVYRAGFKLFK